MKISKSNIGLIKDLILAEISHDILESPKKEDGVQLPFENKKGGLSSLGPLFYSPDHYSYPHTQNTIVF